MVDVGESQWRAGGKVQGLGSVEVNLHYPTNVLHFKHCPGEAKILQEMLKVRSSLDRMAIIVRLKTSKHHSPSYNAAMNMSRPR